MLWTWAKTCSGSDVRRYFSPGGKYLFNLTSNMDVFHPCVLLKHTFLITNRPISARLTLCFCLKSRCRFSDRPDVSVSRQQQHTHTRAHRHTYKHARCWSGLAWIMGSEITTCRPSPVISSFLCLYAPSVYLSFGITTAPFISPSHAYNVCDFFHQPPSLSLPLPPL